MCLKANKKSQKLSSFEKMAENMSSVSSVLKLMKFLNSRIKCDFFFLYSAGSLFFFFF